MKASRAIPGAVRTFARKLVMGSVDLLPFAEREDLRNNSYLLLGLIVCVCLQVDIVLQPPGESLSTRLLSNNRCTVVTLLRSTTGAIEYTAPPSMGARTT